MKFYVGITDEDWYRSLKSQGAIEANFWRPGGTPFRALEPGGTFLFKLRKPMHAIVGGGHFVHYVRMPASAVWSAFQADNGVGSYLELRERISSLSHSDGDASDPEIGCIILAELFFFDRGDWVTPPTDWATNIVSGKAYETTEPEGGRVWNDVRMRIEQVGTTAGSRVQETPVQYVTSLGRRRLGQGAFRALVTEAYNRQCSVTGSKTLPTLEAAHIMPVEHHGSHMVQNGILLRSDLHKLFDRGLLTVTTDLAVRISPRIREWYQNGKEYYALDGRPLQVLPEQLDYRPSKELLEWHGANVYLP